MSLVINNGIKIYSGLKIGVKIVSVLYYIVQSLIKRIALYGGYLLSNFEPDYFRTVFHRVYYYKNFGSFRLFKVDQRGYYFEGSTSPLVSVIYLGLCNKYSKQWLTDVDLITYSDGSVETKVYNRGENSLWNQPDSYYSNIVLDYVNTL